MDYYSGPLSCIARLCPARDGHHLSGQPRPCRAMSHGGRSALIFCKAGKLRSKTGNKKNKFHPLVRGGRRTDRARPPPTTWAGIHSTKIQGPASTRPADRPVNRSGGGACRASGKVQLISRRSSAWKRADVIRSPGTVKTRDCTPTLRNGLDARGGRITKAGTCGS